MTSVYRQLGIGCERLFRGVIQTRSVSPLNRRIGSTRCPIHRRNLLYLPVVPVLPAPNCQEVAKRPGAEGGGRRQDVLWRLRSISCARARGVACGPRPRARGARGPRSRTMAPPPGSTDLRADPSWRRLTERRCGRWSPAAVQSRRESIRRGSETTEVPSGSDPVQEHRVS